MAEYRAGPWVGHCTWLSTHGLGAIKDSGSTLTITADTGSALVKPTSANELSGWIHFTIPSPPATNPNLTTIAIDFQSQSATVETVAVYFANMQKFKEENLQRGQSFKLTIASGSAIYDGKGIAVSIYVKFDNVTSTLRFQSVAVQV